MVLPEELDVLEEFSVVPLVDADAELELELELVDAAVPGIVAALTAAKMPTPATAAIEAPTVMLCKRRRASSRLRARARVTCVGSMVESMGRASQPYLRSGCEVPESGSEGRGYTLVQFNGTQPRKVLPPYLSGAGRAQGALNQNSESACPRSSVDRAGRS